MNLQNNKQLIKKYLNGTATSEEQAILESWYNELAKTNTNLEDEPDYETAHAEILEQLRAKQQPRRSIIWPRIAAAAAILLLATLILLQTRSVKQATDQRTSKTDILPAKSGGVLTLANGQKINLEKISKGYMIYQNDKRIAKVGNSSLVYDTRVNTDVKLSYNELFTPKGRTFLLILADGTKVWLNAGSTLRYPASFVNNERKLFLKGEAYFEVNHDKLKPFYVVTDDQITEDVGTSFNINAYSDEPYAVTTLIEGTVKVMKSDHSISLKPGQQAFISADGKLTAEHVNTDKIMAWRNGMFVFDGENIEVIMRQISRWYNVEVIYQTTTSEKDFVATISRNDKLSEALRKLEYTGIIHFKVEGRKVFVMP